MPLEVLKAAKKKVVGTKQTSKAVEKGVAKIVYIAKDAETKVVANIVHSCEERGIPIEYVDTMVELGKACGIQIGAASAAILEQEG